MERSMRLPKRMGMCRYRKPSRRAYLFYRRASLDIRYTPNLVPKHVQNRTARILETELSRRLSKLRDAVDFSVLDELPDKNGNPL
jgi:hypothetical protein